MTTRLTKEMRNDIIESVMAATDMNTKREAILAETVARAVEVIRESQPEGWFALVEGHPKEWFSLQAEISFAGDLLPQSIMSTESHHYYHQIKLEDSIPVAIYYRRDRDSEKVVFAAVIKKAQAWREEYDATRGELASFLNSCSTTEKVIERMPELEKHIPKRAKVYPLVAPSNVMSRLAKLGFDRTVTV